MSQLLLTVSWAGLEPLFTALTNSLVKQLEVAHCGRGVMIPSACACDLLNFALAPTTSPMGILCCGLVTIIKFKRLGLLGCRVILCCGAQLFHHDLFPLCCTNPTATECTPVCAHVYSAFVQRWCSGEEVSC
jgi:hypothetical protein